MITRTLRPMADSERATVIEILDRFSHPATSRDWLNAVLRGGAFFFCLGWAVYGFLVWQGVPEFIGKVFWIAIAVLGCLLGNRAQEEEDRQRRDAEAFWTRRLMRGEVEVLSVTASAVLSDENAEYYFFQVSDDEVLYLDGAEMLACLDVPESFPTSAFDLVLFPDNGEVLDFINRGKPLEPIYEEVGEEFEGNSWPEDGEVFTGTLATLKNDLKNLKR